MAQQKQSNHGIWDLPNLFKKPRGLVDSLLCVLVAEASTSDRAPQELEIAIPAIDHIGREQPAVNSVVFTGGGNEFAFVGVKLEPNLCGGVLKASKGSSYSRCLSGQTAVIQAGAQAKTVRGRGGLPAERQTLRKVCAFQRKVGLAQCSTTLPKKRDQAGGVDIG
eukprot:10809516-Karenia_brevis.AAC.1